MRAPFTSEASRRQVISRGGNMRRRLQMMMLSYAGFRPTERASSCLVFGGGKAEKLTGVALDGNGGIYAVGVTNSADFPAIDPLQKSLRGTSDVFLTRLALPAMRMTFSTAFGGSGEDSGWGIAVDRRGNPVVAGITDSVDLPGTARSYQQANRGKKDAFVASFQLRHGRRLATYFGGAADDEGGYDGGNVKVDRDGNVWLVGTTYSDDLPTRNGNQSRYGGGNGDGFVAAFDPLLKRLCFATYFGHKERNLLEGIAVSPTGLVAATGVSFSTHLPLHWCRLVILTCSRASMSFCCRDLAYVHRD